MQSAASAAARNNIVLRHLCLSNSMPGLRRAKPQSRRVGTHVVNVRAPAKKTGKRGESTEEDVD
jgi:hypothetical protein